MSALSALAMTDQHQWLAPCAVAVNCQWCKLGYSTNCWDRTLSSRGTRRRHIVRPTHCTASMLARVTYTAVRLMYWFFWEIGRFYEHLYINLGTYVHASMCRGNRTHACISGRQVERWSVAAVIFCPFQFTVKHGVHYWRSPQGIDYKLHHPQKNCRQWGYVTPLHSPFCWCPCLLRLIIIQCVGTYTSLFKFIV